MRVDEPEIVQADHAEAVTSASMSTSSSASSDIARRPSNVVSNVAWFAFAALLSAGLLIGVWGPWLTIHGYRFSQLASAIVALDGSLPSVGGPINGWIALGTICIVAMSSAIALSTQKRWLATTCVAPAALVIVGSLVATLLSDFSPTPFAWVSAVLIVISMLTVVRIRPDESRPRKLGAIVGLVLILSTLTRVVLDVRDAKPSANSASAAALRFVAAATDSDGLEALLLISPRERERGQSIAQQIEAYRGPLDVIRSAFDLSGPTELEVVSQERFAETTIVKLAPSSGAAGVLVDLVGGIPVATVQQNGRWYVSLSSTIDALKP